MKYIVIFWTLLMLAVAAPAAAETFYLKEHPGWQAWGTPEGKLIFTRADRSIADFSITTYAADPDPVTSEEDAMGRMKGIVNRVIKRYPTSCSDLADVDPQPNGMGFEIKNDKFNPSCFLFISLTPEKRLFAHLWIDNNDLPRESQAYQKTGALWMHLAVNRLQGKPLVPTDKTPADLKAIAERVAADHSPEEMILMVRKSSPYIYKALSIYEDQPVTNCANWDPSFYTSADLVAIDASGGLGYMKLNCAIYAHKKDIRTGQRQVYVNGDWGAFSALGEDLGYDHVSDVKIEPFAPGEGVNFLAGSKKRLFDVTRGADIQDLTAADAWFTPDGRYSAGNFGLENRPLVLPMESNGRYYFHEHIVVFERDDGPILIALAGKIVKDGKIDRIFIGGNSYEASAEYQQIRR